MPTSPAPCAHVPFTLRAVKEEMCKAPFGPQTDTQQRKGSSPVASVMLSPEGTSVAPSLWSMPSAV